MTKDSCRDLKDSAGRIQMICILGSAQWTQRSSHRQRAPVKYACAHVSQHDRTSADPLALLKLFRFLKEGSALLAQPYQPWKTLHKGPFEFMDHLLATRDADRPGEAGGDLRRVLSTRKLGAGEYTGRQLAV